MDRSGCLPIRDTHRTRVPAAFDLLFSDSTKVTNRIDKCLQLFYACFIQLVQRSIVVSDALAVDTAAQHHLLNVGARLCAHECQRIFDFCLHAFKL